MSTPRTPRRKTVELRSVAPPSRIRREPPPVEKAPRAPMFDPSEWETWTVVIGVLLFGIAIAIIAIGISEFTS